MRRISQCLAALMLCLLLTTISPVAPVTRAADCTAFLIQEDAAASGLDCPELAALAQAGFVRPEPPAKAKRGRVREIVDGDTIKVSFGDTLDTVRIVNINTPETHDPNRGKQCYGDEASAYIAALIPPGTLVWLERDETNRDRFDRLLRHVWFQQGEGRYRLLGDALVRDGYAEAKDYPPDLKYSTWLHAAQDDAVAHGRGLWSACGGAEMPLIPPTPTPEPVSNPGASGGGAMGIGANCDPSYPDVCIPSPPPDLDCGDIPYRHFRVLPPDPHNFDGNHDGEGCEGG